MSPALSTANSLRSASFRSSRFRRLSTRTSTCGSRRRQPPIVRPRRPRKRRRFRWPTKTSPIRVIDGKIDLGALAAEFFALGLDPYPRKPGAIFDEERANRSQRIRRFRRWPIGSNQGPIRAKILRADGKTQRHCIKFSHKLTSSLTGLARACVSKLCATQKSGERMATREGRYGSHHCIGGQHRRARRHRDVCSLVAVRDGPANLGCVHRLGDVLPLRRQGSRTYEGPLTIMYSARSWPVSRCFWSPKSRSAARLAFRYGPGYAS